jgi:Eco29kI restriction endonuclease
MSGSSMAEPYNPLNKPHLGKSVVEALLASPLFPLGEIVPFEGAGIYAIYYHGPFEPYGTISNADAVMPIYVGKAVPSGSRKGASLTTTSTGNWLFRRISEHRESINSAQNLSVGDFSARYLAVDYRPSSALRHTKGWMR